MKFLLLGRNGMLGRALPPFLRQLGEVVAWGRDEADLEHPAALSERIKREQPDLIVNAAAYTAVDAAEDDRQRAFRINAEAVGVVGEVARSIGAFVVHYSTDFVFDGTNGVPYAETDQPNPLSVYGQSKLAGELALQASGANHMTMRVSWTYADLGKNFPLAILNLAKSRDKIDVVADEVGAATPVHLVASATAASLRRFVNGEKLARLYHFSTSGHASRHQLAQFIVTQARYAGAKLRLRPEAINPIPASSWPSKARRPANSVLDTSRFRATFDLHVPSWREGILQLITKLQMRGEL